MKILKNAFKTGLDIDIFNISILVMNKKQTILKIIDQFFNLKRSELILNGIAPKFWIVPLTKNRIKTMEKFGYNFIKEFNDPEINELVNKNKPCLLYKKNGIIFIIKEII